MNRKEFEEAVFASSMNGTAKTVCMAYAYYQQYKHDGSAGVWPSQAKIAKDWSLNKNTVSKYVQALIEAGWFVEIGRKGEADRVLVLRLEHGDDSHDVLTNRRRGQSRDTLKKDSISYQVGDASPNRQDMHVLTDGRPSPNSKERTTKNNEENNNMNNQDESASASSSTSKDESNKEDQDRAILIGSITPADLIEEESPGEAGPEAGPTEVQINIRARKNKAAGFFKSFTDAQHRRQARLELVKEMREARAAAARINRPQPEPAFELDWDSPVERRLIRT